MRFRIVFSDLDGTLLDDHQRIGERTLAAVSELTRRGIPFVPVSARMPGAILPLTRRLGVRTPMVCFNGGLLRDAEGRTIAGTPIPHETVARALAAIRRVQEEIGLSVASNIYTEDLWLTQEPESIQALRESEVVRMKPTKVDYEEFLRGDLPVYKLSCCTDYREKTGAALLEERLARALPELAVHSSAGWYLELSAASATKGNGLIRMCELLQIPREESIAFGDNYNDVDMLQAAGFGVCMANGPAEVKAAADAVTPKTNEEEGLAQYLCGLL